MTIEWDAEKMNLINSIYLQDKQPKQKQEYILQEAR